MVTGSPAWKPHATLALVTSRNIEASSPMFQEPNDSPRSALRSKVVAFQRQVVRCGGVELAGDGLRHGTKRFLRVRHHCTPHHEVTGSAHHCADAKRQRPAKQRGALALEEVLEEGFLDP